MTANDQNKLIPLELTLDDLCWLRAFLKEEISAAELDREKVFSLHTSQAIRAAKKTLEREHETMVKIYTAIDKTLQAVDAREAIIRMIETTTPGHPLVD